jgi:hypothetical protein
MRQEKAFSLYHDGFRLAMNHHSRLLSQPTKRPNIVVANKEMYLNPFIRYLSDSLQERAILLPTLILPKKLTPEVKNISHKKDCLRIIGHSVEPLDKHLLNGTRLAHSLRAEMHI